MSAPNKLAIALQVREAMRAYRKGKPVAFQVQQYPRGGVSPSGKERP
jgi:hypothetical protein